jgi:cytochrome c oxidase subunit 2
MEGRARSFSRSLIIVSFVGFALATVAGGVFLNWRLSVASEHGRGVDAMILFLLLATGPMFVGGHLLVASFVWKSGRKDAPAFRRPSRRAEWTATLIPVVIIAAVAEGGVLVIGMPVWSQIYREDAEALPVEVVGKQFEWISRYPGKDGKYGRTDPAKFDEVENPLGLDEDDPAAADDIVIRGALYLPVNRTASIRIRSLDVLHSFSVAQFRTKQDAVPGIPTRTQVRPTATGQFDLVCAELCGMGHYRMRGTVKVLSKEDFEEWLSRQTGWFE